MKPLKSSLKRIKRERERIAKESSRRVMIDFVDVQNRSLGKTFDMSLDCKVEDINQLLISQLKNHEEEYQFYFRNYRLRNNFKEIAAQFKDLATEGTLKLHYVPDSLIGVRPITRISSSLEGHTKSVLDVKFSPNNKFLATCSGDMTVRLWDVNTEMPIAKFEKIHRNWILALAWSPDSSRFAAGDYNGLISVTIARKIPRKSIKKKEVKNKKINESNGSVKKEGGKKIISTKPVILKGHKSWITSLAFSPYHLDPDGHIMVSGSKDKTVRLWNTVFGRQIATGAVHSEAVTRVTWSARGYILSASQDRQIIIWSRKLKYLRALPRHAHWVNCLSLNTEHVLNSAFFEQSDYGKISATESLPKATKVGKAKRMIRELIEKSGGEYLLSGSDDNTVNLYTLGFPPLIGSNSAPKILDSGEKVSLSKRQNISGPETASKNKDKDSQLKKQVTLYNISPDENSQKSNCQSFKLVRKHTGHSKQVNHVMFAPNGIIFMSASFDRTLRVWSTFQSGCLAVLRGHVAAVYR